MLVLDNRQSRGVGRVEVGVPRSHVRMWRFTCTRGQRAQLQEPRRQARTGKTPLSQNWRFRLAAEPEMASLWPRHYDYIVRAAGGERLCSSMAGEGLEARPYRSTAPGGSRVIERR